LKIGDRVGDYVVLDVLGTGGFATVYEARHAALGSRHALKILAPHLSGNREIRARFLAEGRILARLRHPNLVRVTAILALPGVAGLVMDFVKGRTLEEVLRGRREPMALPEIVAVMAPVLDALAVAHGHGVVHRDLKPANLILGADDDGEVHPVVLDFGIAKLMENASVTKHHDTRTHMQMGTVGYMSPEQIREARDVDERTDVFALGCIVYELATGVAAFTGDSAFDVQCAIVGGTADVSRLPVALRGLVGNMLGPVARRPRSCSQIAGLLRAMLERRTPAAQSPMDSAQWWSDQVLSLSSAAGVRPGGGPVVALVTFPPPRVPSRSSNFPVRPVVVAPPRHPRPVHRTDTKRPLNFCDACGNQWFPKGQNRSKRCPRCRETDVVVIERTYGGFDVAMAGAGVLSGVMMVLCGLASC